MGKVLFDDLQRAACISCGRADVQLVVLDKAASRDIRACPSCIARYDMGGLSQEADRLLASAVHRNSAVCLHCGQPVVSLYPNPNMAPAWCSDCERERRQIAAARSAHA